MAGAAGEFLGNIGELDMGTLSAIYLAVFIGGITFTGSVVAFSKLAGMMSSKALALPARDQLNLCMLGMLALGMAGFLDPSLGNTVGMNNLDPETIQVTSLSLAAFVSSVLGFHLVASIGGPDMPVVITVLNSYSGWALVAGKSHELPSMLEFNAWLISLTLLQTPSFFVNKNVEGFLLRSPLLCQVGALIGFSGAILTWIMCVAMGRSIVSVIFGGAGSSVSPTGGGEAAAMEGEITIGSVDNLVESLMEANNIMIVPGYGLAVAQAQFAVADIAKKLKAMGKNVRFGIHPGELPMFGAFRICLLSLNWIL